MSSAATTSDRADGDKIALAAALIPQLRERHAETDRLCRLPDETVADFEQAGLFRMMTPRAYGGLQSSIADYMRTTVEIGRGDGSAGWALALINTCTWMAATLYPRSVTDQIFVDPEARVAGVISPRFCKAHRVPGGIVVDDGLWGFNSGVYHVQWDLLGVPIFDESGVVVDQGIAAVPMSDVTLLHDWDTVGIRGSGSTSVAMKDVFIPDERIASLSAAVQGKYQGPFQDAALYRSAFVPYLAMILTFPTLGMGRAMVDVFLDKLPKRGIAYSPYPKQAEAVVTQVQLAEAEAKIDAAQLVVANAISEIEHWAERGELMPFLQRARIRRDVGLVGQLVWEGVDMLASAAGGSLASASNPLNRIWRDARIANMHGIFTAMTNYELYGRLMCGQEPNTPLI